jgi:hypothetical protein
MTIKKSSKERRRRRGDVVTNAELNEEWRKRAEERLLEAIRGYLANRVGLSELHDAVVDLVDLEAVRE